MIFLKTTGDGVEAIYEDEALKFLAKLGDFEPARRVSHVDPGPLVDGHPTWVIYWQGAFIDLFGPVTYCRQDGTPFKTRREAIEYEVEVLKRYYFKLG